jgi:endonuclease-3
MILQKEKIYRLIRKLDLSIKNPKTSLKYRNQFTLLISVLLSAQCTDVNVNNVTRNIYKKYYQPEHFLKLRINKIKKLIKNIGLFNIKAKNIYNLSKILIKKYKGNIPKTFDELIQLPGVGRKTANVVLNAAFHKATIAVDTHVFRVSRRIGLVPMTATTPLAVEKGLNKNIPTHQVHTAHHWLILHGRYTCLARSPKCDSCGITEFCKFFAATNKIQSL